MNLGQLVDFYPALEEQVADLFAPEARQLKGAVRVGVAGGRRREPPTPPG